MLNVDLDPAHYDAVRKNGIAFRPQLALPAGSYRLRLGVVDMTNSRVGTLDAPFTIQSTTVVGNRKAGEGSGAIPK